MKENLSFHESIPLHIWRDYQRWRGSRASEVSGPPPDHVIRYFDLVADSLLALPYARESERIEKSRNIPGSNRVPPDKKGLKKQLLRALQFDPPNSNGFHQYARHNRLAAIAILIDYEKSLGNTTNKGIEAAISEKLVVDMDQAENLRVDATRYEGTYASERGKTKQKILAWLGDREARIIREVKSSLQTDKE